METLIWREELEKLKAVRGNARGLVFKTVLEFVIRDQGREGLKRLEETMADLGLPIKYEEIKATQVFPLRTYLVLQLAIKEIFQYNDQKFQAMGAYMCKASFIVRLLLKHFSFIFTASEQAPRAWRNYFDVGEMEITELSRGKRVMVVRLKNFDFHPLHYEIVKGFLGVAMQLVVSSPTSCEQTKSGLEGQSYNEFVVRW